MVRFGPFRKEETVIDLIARLTTGPMAPIDRNKLEISNRTDEKGGFVYVVRTSEPKDRTTAAALCRSLKSTGQPCGVELKEKEFSPWRMRADAPLDPLPGLSPIVR